MESFLIHWGYAAVFLFGFLEAACIPIPSEITFGFAGVLASEGHLSIVGVIVVGTVAELIGSFVSYAVGRAGGRPLVHRFGRYLLITLADLDRAERFVAGRGIWAIPLGRALPVVRTFVSLVAGFIEVPPLLFGVLSLIGTAVWVTVISLIGYGVGSAWQSVAHGLAVAGYAIVVVAVIAVAAFIAYRVREIRHEAARRQVPGGRHAAQPSSGPPGNQPGASSAAMPGDERGAGSGAPGAASPGDQPSVQPSPRSPAS
jgi:membrane protein DedA with SNARE-associated domain